MDRRTFIAMTLAGCVAPGAPDLIGTSSDPAAPPLAPPDPMAKFADWLGGFRARALLDGIAPEVLDRELAGLTPNQTVVGLDNRQPEFSKPMGVYLQSAVSEDRIARGRALRDSLPGLDGMEARYGVPRDIVLAVWAVESAFGKAQGDFDVVRAFATLAYDGRRAEWAEGELLACLRIIASGEADRARLTGSWAGAMGQTQFLPTVFLSTAVDADGDGKRDIWGSSADALASTANYLAKAGWRRGVGWAHEVTLPSSFDYGLAETLTQPTTDWVALGVVRADGAGFGTADSAAPAVLLLPAGARGPAFLALKNHFVIRAYNNATSYALAVGLLADRFAGGAPLVAAWPQETPLSLADRMAAQAALARAGFNPGPQDGVIGVGTRAALRNWQKARGLPADGYLSAEMLVRLRSEAPGL